MSRRLMRIFFMKEWRCQAASSTGCPEELVVPASGESIPIDDINDGPSLQFTVSAPDGTTKAVRSCYENMSWIPAPLRVVR